MTLRSGFLNLGRVINDASFVLLDPCSGGEKLKSLSQLVRIGLFSDSRSGSSAVVGQRDFRVRYPDPPSFWQAYHEIFMRQVYFFAALNESPVIFDCGANIGLATLYFKTLYPRCVVEAFEPDPQTFGILEHNVSRNNLEGVSLHRCALWDAEGELDFYTGKNTPSQLSMSAACDRLNGQSTRIRVPAMRLSRFLDGKVIDFLKIDVEGSEEHILADLEKEGSFENIRQMAIEYHHPPERESSRLGQTLAMLERENFACEVCADLRPRVLRDPFHDVMIYARRKDQ